MSGIKSIRSDGWENVITGLGNVFADKQQSLRHAKDVPFSDIELENLFHCDDVAYRIVVGLPEEAYKRGVMIMTSADVGEDVTAYASAINDELVRIGAHEALYRATIWGRLFGGGIVVVSVDDGVLFREELRHERIRSIDSLHVFDRRDFTHIVGNDIYQLRTVGTKVSNDDTSGLLDIHSSRLVIFGGALTSRRERLSRSGWDHSVLQRCRQSMQSFASDWQSSSAMVADGSQGVLKIKGLYDLLAGGFRDQLQTRLDLMSLSRFIGKVLPIDSEEEFSYVDRTFSGISDFLTMGMYRLSAAAEMPATLLFGRSPAGMNATGESDMEIWRSRVSAAQTQEYGKRYDQIVRIVAHTLGIPEPDSWRVAWQPLKSQSDQEKSTTRKTYADIDTLYINAGVLDPDEVAAVRFSNGEWTDRAPIPDMSLRGAKYTPDDTDTDSSPSVGRDDMRLDGYDEILDSVLMKELEAVKALWRISAPPVIIAPLVRSIVHHIGLIGDDVVDVVVNDAIDSWIGGEVSAMPEQTSIDSSSELQRMDFNDMNELALTDLKVLETFGLIGVPSVILSALVSRVYSSFGMLDARLHDAIAQQRYVIRPRERQVSILVRAENA